ncbi:hypothetical protein LTR85_000690 [Meristemomyces frigidus]|nr:hypothetical protein LTR85_000690 [Meristemomyces frigidus]
MDSALDNNVVRNSTPAELAKYLRAAPKARDSNAVTVHLLAAIASESVPPTVFSTWLSVTHDPAALVQALHQQQSVLVRRLAITSFGKWFRSSRVSEVWSALGGTEGLLQFLTQASVNEVDLFCRTVGRSSTTLVSMQERRQLVTELAKALAYESFPDADYKTEDRRPLLHHYAKMVAAGTVDFVAAWMENKALPRPGLKRLMRAHPDTIRQRYIEDIVGKKTQNVYAPLLTGLPPVATQEQGVSESMAFSIRLLQETNTNGSVIVNAHLFWNSLAVPLVRRLWLRRCSNVKRLAVLGLILTYAQRHADAAATFDLGHGAAVAFVVRMWSRHPDRFQDLLVAFLQLTSTTVAQTFKASAALAEIVRPQLRLLLVRLLLQHLKCFSLDLESDEDLKNCKIQWPVRLLLALPRADARKLLQRLIRLRPEGSFLDRSNLQHHQSICGFQSRNDDPILLLLYLSRGEAGALELARAAVDNRKKSASTSREQEDRAYWAKEAIFCAIASGSLDVYQEILLWARRYKRDALTTKALYVSETIQTTEGLDMLCGIADRPCSSEATVESVERDVRKGNDICKLLLETAGMAVQEPSFYDRDWIAVLTLFKAVVQRRLDRVNRLQDTLHLSNAATYQAVWQNTLETCLALERLGHQNGYAALGFDKAAGPLAVFTGPLIANLTSRATLKFVDELAKDRDELWQDLRRAAQADVVTLTAPWPRGLPVQQLLPLDVTKSREGYTLPHLLSRAERVVFVSAEAAFGNADDASGAVGSFVEDWQASMKFYVNAASNGNQRQERILLAWHHAVNELTGSRMSTQEAALYWQNIFNQTGIDTSCVSGLQPPKRPDPSLPSVEDPAQPTEWNPDPNPAQFNMDSRELRSVALDCMLNPSNKSSATSGLSTAFKICTSRTVAWQHCEFWDCRHEKPLTPGAKEALIAAALLFLNSKRCPSHRLLAEPFPPRAQDSARFPALYLDGEFLDRKDSLRLPALDTLEALPDTAPPSLLYELARAMFEALKEQRNAGWEHHAFAVMMLLATSDRPSLSLPLIKELVLERPDDSSWHRHLLHPGLFKRLPARIANEFLTTLSLEIRTKQETAPQATTGALQAATLPTAKRAIKISTIKMLAQLLANADFVERSFAVELLIGLLAHANHLDVRVAAVESLLGAMIETYDPELKAMILAALEQHAVPVAGAISERRPMSEDDWEQFEVREELPEVDIEPAWEKSSPILHALQNTCQSHNIPEDERGNLVARIMLPILRLSAFNNRRWMALFVQKFNIDVPIAELPAVPVKLNFLPSLLFRFIDWIPSSVFEIYAEFIITCLDPPRWLQTVNHTIFEDMDLRSSNAGGHWLSLWNIRGAPVLSLGGHAMCQYFRQPWESKLSDGVTYDQMRQRLLKAVDIVIMEGDIDFTMWSALQAQLKPRLNHKEGLQRYWYQYCQPVVEQIVLRVDELRTAPWQRDPKSPAMLPDVSVMRLWLLTYPSMPRPWLRGEHMERRDVFIAEVCGIIEQLADSRRPYHERFQQLKNAVMQLYDIDYAYIAAALNPRTKANPPHFTLAECLRIDLADALIRHAAEPKDANDTTATRAMLQSWTHSEDEDVRMRGLRTVKSIMDNGNKKQAWLRAALS